MIKFRRDPVTHTSIPSATKGPDTVRSRNRPLWYEMLDLAAAIALVFLAYNNGWLDPDPTADEQILVSTAAAQYARGDTALETAQRTNADQPGVSADRNNPDGAAGSDLSDPMGLVFWRFSP